MIDLIKAFTNQIMIFLAAACLTLGGLAYYYRSELRVALSGIDAANAQTAIEQANTNACKQELQDQNAAIERMRHDRPPPTAITRTEYRDRIVVRYVDRNITQEECRETSAHIDAARRMFP
jgi:hypothetical protein